MNGSVGLDIDDIADLVNLEESGDRRHSILTEWTPERNEYRGDIPLNSSS